MFHANAPESSDLFDLSCKANSESVWELADWNNYQLAGCGREKVDILVQQLHALLAALPPIIQDAKNSTTNPSKAYRVFFKDPANAEFVASILTNVLTGVAKRPAVPPLSRGNPTIVCIDPSRPEQNFNITFPDRTSDVITYCSPGDPPAGYFNPTPFIILCPSFFSGPAVVGPGTRTCPIFNHRLNQFIARPEDFVTGSSVWYSMQWVLLEEIVHYYLYASKGMSLIPEVYDINGVWKLDATDSLVNGISYAYYAGSVHAKCRDWPRRRRRSDDRELLEGSRSLGGTADGLNHIVNGLGGALNVSSVHF
ncbi:MAG: hypothetical protein Q9219_005898 [cf. Caloplaca sp. 3 TL-2023]